MVSRRNKWADSSLPSSKLTPLQLAALAELVSNHSLSLLLFLTRVLFPLFLSPPRFGPINLQAACGTFWRESEREQLSWNWFLLSFLCALPDPLARNAAHCVDPVAPRNRELCARVTHGKRTQQQREEHQQFCKEGSDEQ